MGWSSSAPSGVTFSDNTAVTATKAWNHYKLELTVWTARKTNGGNAFYLKVKAKWKNGTQGDYQKLPRIYWYTTSGTESASEKEQIYDRPDNAGETQYKYYAGTRGSAAGTVTVGLSSNSEHTSGDTLTVSPDLAAATYAVSYDANGGNGAVSGQTKTYGTALTLRSGGFSRSGHTFSGWNTKADGTGTSYAAGGSYTANAAVTLYAQWIEAPAASTDTWLNASGTVVQAAAAYVNVNGTICEAEIYANVNGGIVKI